MSPLLELQSIVLRPKKKNTKKNKGLTRKIPNEQLSKRETGERSIEPDISTHSERSPFHQRLTSRFSCEMGCNTTRHSSCLFSHVLVC